MWAGGGEPVHGAARDPPGSGHGHRASPQGAGPCPFSGLLKGTPPSGLAEEWPSREAPQADFAHPALPLVPWALLDVGP